MRSMIVLLVTVTISAAIGTPPADATGERVNPEIAVRLAERFRPQVVTDCYASWGDLDYLESKWVLPYLSEANGDGPYWGPLAYRELHSGEDRGDFLILVWRQPNCGLYWVLLRHENEDWALVDTSERWLALPDPWWLTRADLDGDGEGEVLLAAGEFGRHIECLFAYRWNGDSLELITPYEDENPDPLVPLPPAEGDWTLVRSTEVCTTNNDVEIVDLDGDGKAELVVYPEMEHVPEGDYGFRWVYVEEDPKVRVYALDEHGRYALEEAVSPDEWRARREAKTPTTAVAAVAPGTIVASTLTVETDGVLRVFVSRAAWPYSGEAWDPNGFRLQFAEGGVRFVKEWKNVEFPSPLDGNAAFEGVPVRQEPRRGGAWEVDPARPAVPAPDPEWRYRLVGPYVELEVDRAVAYPYLARAAGRFFEDNPGKEIAWLSLPIEGRLGNGRRVLVEAFVCIRRAGHRDEEGAGATAPPAR